MILAREFASVFSAEDLVNLPHFHVYAHLMIDGKPALDIVEKRDAYIVVAELPGVSQSNVELSFEQNVLTIRGHKNPSLDPAKDGELRVYTAERVAGTFERAIRLPEFVDSERITADLRDGLLAVTIPKATAAQPRKIEIKASGEAHALNS